MRVQVILNQRRNNRMLASFLMGGLLSAQCLVAPPAFAERVEPQLELAPFSTEADPAAEERFTPVFELEGFPEISTTVSPATETGDTRPNTPAVTVSNGDGDVPTLRANVEIEKEFVPDITFGENHTVEKGQKLILSIMDMVATGYSQHGDEFHARLRQAVTTEEGDILIPKGTIFKGHIESTEEPGKSLSRNGKITLAFDYILMPDGRKVPLDTEYTKGDNALLAFGRAVGGGIGGTISGALRGALVGLSFGGLGAAAATNGATVIGGSGLGALAGLGNGISRSGDHILLNEGDQIKVALEKPLTLPTIHRPPDTVNEIHAEGLNVSLTDYQLTRDPFKVEHQIELKVKVDNQTSYQFGSFDLVLMDEYNNVFAISPFGRGNMMFRIGPKSEKEQMLSFSVKSPDLRHYLVFYKPYTREVLAKISLTEALKQLSHQEAGDRKRRHS